MSLHPPQSSIMGNRGNSKNKATLTPSLGKSTPPAACIFLHVGVKVIFSKCGLETSCFRISWHELAENVDAPNAIPKDSDVFGSRMGIGMYISGYILRDSCTV